MPRCPCCGSADVAGRDTPQPHRVCGSCGHRFRGADPRAVAEYYAGLEQRNPRDVEAKVRDRMADLAPLLRPGLRVLEVGCAEGDLGRRVKAVAAVYYAGVEPSRDALRAQAVLDRVVREGTATVDDAPYDLVLAFHVLEHLPDPAAEAAEWRRLLAPGGRLIVEVPHGAGHALVDFDRNAEHLHQFTAASLCALLERADLELVRLSSGHFESPLYSDSLRAMARPATVRQERRRLLLERFKGVLPGSFAVYAVGGDFRNYVLPFLDALPISALFDSDPARHGERIGRLAVEPFDARRHANDTILVASLRHGMAIRAALLAAGVRPERIVGIEAVYGAAQ